MQLPPLSDTFFFSLAGNGTTIYAGTSSTIFRSVDNGQTWVAGSTGLPGDTVTAIRLINNTIIAGTYSSGIYLSNNGGPTWTPANN